VELSRAERLLADKAIAQREFDERASSLKELDANARAAQAQYESAKLNLTYTRWFRQSTAASRKPKSRWATWSMRPPC
jgi:multidrug resistance efflux pump